MEKISETTMQESEKAAAGAAVYSKFVLSLYDIQVLMFEMRFIFKCPTTKILNFYNSHISGTHLDVGVGTGYFLDKCHFPVLNPTIHLMDLNLNSLQKTSNRIKRYKPATHQQNVLEPIQEELPAFNSIAAVNFLHCLPGNMLNKEKVIKNLKPFLSKEGVFFGVTVLGQNIDAGILYKITNSIYNKTSVFCNLNDNPEDLELILDRNFNKYYMEIVGSVALFSGQSLKNHN